MGGGALAGIVSHLPTFLVGRTESLPGRCSVRSRLFDQLVRIGLSRFSAVELTAVKKSRIPGDHSEGATPVPVPNTEVKPLSADGTALETAWESRTSPGAYSKGLRFLAQALFLLPGRCGDRSARQQIVRRRPRGLPVYFRVFRRGKPPERSPRRAGACSADVSNDVRIRMTWRRRDHEEEVAGSRFNRWPGPERRGVS